MYQQFDDVGGPAHGAERVRLLRDRLGARQLAGFLVPRADEYQNEYVPPSAERLLWLTGFSGSWGLAAVLTHKAALFIDGRYTLQAAKQADTAVFELVKITDTTPGEWLAANLGEGDRLGYDPHLHTVSDIRQLSKTLGPRGVSLVPLDANPLDQLWTDRPAEPKAQVVAQPLAFAGRSTGEKLTEIRAALSSGKADAAVITMLDSIAWLFNIRGGDLPHTPFTLSHAIVPAEGKPMLFLAGEKLQDNALRSALSDIAELQEPASFEAALAALGEGKARVRLDPGRSSQWIATRLTEAGAQVIEAEDPCILPKAIKNSAEIEGSRAAHRRDGAVMCRFLAWLDAEAPGGALDEIGAAERLEALRRETGALKEISFDTISGAGPNGAIVHYRVTRSTNRLLEPGSLYLIDSGGQYQDGTTDITRTVAIGQPTDEMRRHFTLVLKGHIAIATARFPKGTRGVDIDGFARRALWDAGLDYDHGTGHGVGSYLSVHEGPQGISKRAMTEFKPGMIVSNEPGYYREGAYGIRIENLVLVSEPELKGGDRPMLSFETLTLAPIDRRLIDASLLSEAELGWLNAYHARVKAELGGEVEGKASEWLAAACAPIAVSSS